MPFKTIKDKELKKNIRKNGNKFIELRSAQGVFHDVNNNVMNKTNSLMDTNRCYVKHKFILNKLCEKSRDEGMLLAICFVFSRKGVENCAK